MKKQPALRLANALGKYRTPPEAAQAAAELRRLHDEVQQLKSDLSEEVLIYLFLAEFLADEGM